MTEKAIFRLQRWPFESKPNLGQRSRKLLALESRDLSQAEKKIYVAKAEQIQLFSLKMATFDHFE